MKKLLLLVSVHFIFNFMSGQSWEYLGNCCIDSPVGPLSSSGSEDLDFTNDGRAVVSYFSQTGGNTTAKCKIFENNNWQALGSTIPVSGAIQRMDLEIFESDIFIAILSGATDISVWQYSNGSWLQLGGIVTANLAYEFELNNEGDMFLFLASSSKIMKYNGNDWEEIFSQNTGSSLSWSGERSVICDEDNNFYYNETTLTPQFSFITQLMKFDGISSTPVGEVVYSGGGINGKLAYDNDGNIYNQYTINNTNKIVKLTNNNWEHQIDTTNALNTIFGFNYIFNSNNELLLQNGMNLYYGDSYQALSSPDVENMPIIINDLAISPEGVLHISFGEIAPGSGADFSVMKFTDINPIKTLRNEELKVYPNPANNEINIVMNRPVKRIEIFDGTGKICFSDEYLNQLQFKVDVSSFSSGVYMLHTTTEQGEIYKEILIKQ